MQKITMRTPIELVEYALSDWEAAGKIERYEDLPERFRECFDWWAFCTNYERHKPKPINPLNKVEESTFCRIVIIYIKELGMSTRVDEWLWGAAFFNQSDFQCVAIQPRIEFLRGLLNKLKAEQ